MSDIDKGLCWCGEECFEIPAGSCWCEEIKQLQKRIEELESVWRCEHCGSDKIYSGPPDCPDCGAPNCCQTCCKIATQEMRIEELEKDRRISDGLPHPWYGPCDGFGPDGTCVECREVREHCLEHNYYPITGDQIDAAWEFALESDQHVSLDLLSKLGIVRCETCPWHQPVPDVCPDCNGKGWVIGGNDGMDND